MFRFLSIIVGSLSVIPFAFGAPIVGPIWIIDDPEVALVEFSHGGIAGPAVHLLGPFISPLGNWAVAVTITECHLCQDGADYIILSGAARHLVAPHPSDIAPNVIFELSSFDIVAPAGRGSRGHFERSFVDHQLNDADTGRLGVVFDFDDKDFSSYRVFVGLAHVPEPGTMLLVGCGMALMFRFGLRRNRPASW